jgi:hypothetical protein
MRAQRGHASDKQYRRATRPVPVPPLRAAASTDVPRRLPAGVWQQMHVERLCSCSCLALPPLFSPLPSSLFHPIPISHQTSHLLPFRNRSPSPSCVQYDYDSQGRRAARAIVPPLPTAAAVPRPSLLHGCGHALLGLHQKARQRHPPGSCSRALSRSSSLVALPGHTPPPPYPARNHEAAQALFRHLARRLCYELLLLVPNNVETLAQSPFWVLTMLARLCFVRRAETEPASREVQSRAIGGPCPSLRVWVSGGLGALGRSLPTRVSVKSWGLTHECLLCVRP